MNILLLRHGENFKAGDTNAGKLTRGGLLFSVHISQLQPILENRWHVLEIWASAAERCIETVRPLAEALGKSVETYPDHAFQIKTLFKKLASTEISENTFAVVCVRSLEFDLIDEALNIEVPGEMCDGYDTYLTLEGWTGDTYSRVSLHHYDSPVHQRSKKQTA